MYMSESFCCPPETITTLSISYESEVAQSCSTLCNPVDCRPPGSSVHGIFQARVLEWGAIAFSDIILSKSVQFTLSVVSDSL